MSKLPYCHFCFCPSYMWPICCLWLLTLTCAELNKYIKAHLTPNIVLSCLQGVQVRWSDHSGPMLPSAGFLANLLVSLHLANRQIKRKKTTTKMYTDKRAGITLSWGKTQSWKICHCNSKKTWAAKYILRPCMIMRPRHVIIDIAGSCDVGYFHDFSSSTPAWTDG